MVNLNKASLTGSINLTSTQMRVASNLQGIHLPGFNLVEFDLSLLNLSEANLSNTDLCNANLENATLTGTKGVILFIDGTMTESEEPQ